MKDSFALQWYDSTDKLSGLVGIRMTEEKKEKISRFKKKTIEVKVKSKALTLLLSDPIIVIIVSYSCL